ncbi:MAG: hypothetical protein Q8P12_07755 [bacterium]|nr:hypothetical protein [bacterium]
MKKADLPLPVLGAEVHNVTRANRNFLPLMLCGIVSFPPPKTDVSVFFEEKRERNSDLYYFPVRQQNVSQTEVLASPGDGAGELQSRLLSRPDDFRVVDVCGASRTLARWPPVILILWCICIHPTIAVFSLS